MSSTTQRLLSWGSKVVTSTVPGTVPGTRLAVTGMMSFLRSSSSRTSCACTCGPSGTAVGEPSSPGARPAVSDVITSVGSNVVRTQGRTTGSSVELPAVVAAVQGDVDLCKDNRGVLFLVREPAVRVLILGDRGAGRCRPGRPSP